jgi:hypothetical protein
MTKFFDLVIILTMLFSIGVLSQSSILPNVEYKIEVDTLVIKDTILIQSEPKIEERVQIKNVSLKDVNFNSYMNLPLRKKLTDSSNDGTINPDPTDSGNWTECKCGKGNLVGTYRDISACALSAYLKRSVTVKDLRSLTEEDAKKIIKTWWDNMQMSKIPDQDVANLIFHIKMHFGNIQIVQKALNIKDNNVIEILVEKTKFDPIETYNKIRENLKKAYENCNPKYRKGFMRFLTEDFPEKNEIHS